MPFPGEDNQDMADMWFEEDPTATGVKLSQNPLDVLQDGENS